MHCATRRAALRPRWLASATPTARRKDCVGQSPPTNKDGPRAAKPQDRPTFAPASAADQPPAGASSAAIVRQAGGKHRKARGPRIPAVFASVYEPCEGRSQWAFAYICPWCHLGHLGRAKTEADVTGPRRSRCGRLVVVRAARVYRNRTAA
jgi:hypothetical protein